MEQRIKSSVRDNNLQDVSSSYWSLVVGEANDGKELWKYICALTFSRPRDIIKLMKYCSNRGHIRSLIQSDVEAIENDFSDWFYREFRDEVHSFFECWQSALNCLSEIAKGKEKKEVLLKKFDETPDIQKWCKDRSKTSLDVMKILFDYSVIGCINEYGRWIFKYKDDHFMFMSSYPYYCVHYGFCRKLRIIRSYDSQVIDALTNH